MKLQTVDSIPKPKRLMEAGGRRCKQFSADGKIEGLAVPVEDDLGGGEPVEQWIVLCRSHEPDWPPSDLLL